MIPVSELRKNFLYNSRTGEFVWKLCPRQPSFVGKRAGCMHRTGYWYISLKSERVRAHRAAWAMYYGAWPKFPLDHKDLNKSNNRIKNLRRSSKSKNGANRPKQKNNTSGHKGVFWMKRAKFWLVQIRARNKLYYIGITKNKKVASKMYATAAKRLHGEFARAA